MAKKAEEDKHKKAEQQRERRRQLNTNERPDGNPFVKAMLGTVGAVAGASVLYRTGAIASMARTTDSFTRFLKDANTLADRHLQGDPTLTNYKHFYRDAKQAWKNRRNEGQKGVHLSHRNGTLLNFITEMRAAGDPSAMVNRNFSSLVEEAGKTHFQNVYAKNVNFDYNTTNKFNNFIRALSKNAGDLEHAAKTERNFHFEGVQLAVAKDLERHMAEKAKDKSLREIAKGTVGKHADSITKIGLSIETLKRHFGQKEETVGDKLIKLIKGNDRAATVKDVLDNTDQILDSYNYAAEGRKQKIQSDIDLLKELREKFKESGQEEDFLGLKMDSFGLRVSSMGELYSFDSAQDIYSTAMSGAAATLPGKILKLRDFQYLGKAPAFHYFAKGEKDPILTARINKDRAKRGEETVDSLDANYYQIGDRIFRGLEDGTIQDTGYEGMHLVSGRYGAQYNLLRKMLGDTRYKEGGKLTSALDLFQDYESWNGSIFGNAKSVFTKKDDPSWRGNVMDRFLDNTEEKRIFLQNADNKMTAEQALSFLDDADKARQLLHENTYALDQESIQKILGQMDEKSEAYQWMKMLESSDVEDVLYSVMQKTGSSISKRGDFRNSGLSRLIKLKDVDPGDAENIIALQNGETRGIPVSELISLVTGNNYNQAADFEKQLRAEVAKEAMLTFAAEQHKLKTKADGMDFDAVFTLIANSKLRARNDVNARRLVSESFLEEAMGTNMRNRLAPNADGVLGPTGDMMAEMDSIFSVTSGASNASKEFRKTFQALKDEQIGALEGYNQTPNIETPAPYSEWIHINDSTGVMDMIKSMNDWTKFKATSKKFVSQWNAGRDNPEDISTYTLAPYFFLSRLSDDMNTFGLGFSRDSVGSTGDFLKNIMLKRVAPAIIGATYFEWLDDTSQEITGTSITGAFVNGVADVDLALRKGADAVGLTEWLNEEKSINPIMQYWGDHTNFMSYDERKHYYEKGYDPVRKGAFWTFGGVNEMRGSEIQYWQPNIVRRVNSDYEDKALYDGYFDKWSHSWLPTPSNPLSPIMAILDPYWMEEKHADDRPYPVSGPMFDEGTPWGGILNSTVGAVLKPEKELHPWRLRNGVDIMSTLHRINEYIKDTARDIGRRNYAVLNGNTATPMTFTSFNAPTEDTKVLSAQMGGNGGVARIEEGVYERMGTGTSATFGLADQNGSGVSTSGAYTQGNGIASILTSAHEITANDLLAQPDDDINYTDVLKQKLLNVGDGYVQNGKIITDKDGKLETVKVANKFGEAPNKEDGKIGLEDSLELDAIINGDETGLKKTAANFVRKFNPVHILRDMNDITKAKAKAINEAYDKSEGIMSPDKLSHYRPSQGMELLDDPGTVSDLINAGQGFDYVHDAAVSARLIGGIYGYMAGATVGLGDQTEKRIARSNDMTSFSRTFWDSGIGGAGGNVMEIVRRFIPDFKRGTRVNPLLNEMPDWLPERFKYGDPFTALPKGEMRLPGKGYEALNELHEDQFGKYGAFDRMKILADIAPFSPEYRLWKQIAAKTVTDPELIEEMDEIKDRVAQQGKKHDFYNYKVIGHGVSYKNVVVSEILDHGKFRSGNQIYKIAGVSIKGNAEQNMKEVLGRYIAPGDEVTVAVDDNDAEGENKDTNAGGNHSVNAAVFTAGGQNVGTLMLEQGDAKKRKGDTSAAATLTNYSALQKVIAGASELVAHADVPWLSDQFLRVRSPYESYQAEQIYGTPYQSWEHPIDSFLMPAIERAVHERDWWNTPLTWAAKTLIEKEGLSGSAAAIVDTAYALTNRGAFIGGAIGNLIAPGKGRKLMYATSNITAGLHVLTGGNGDFDQAMSAAFISKEIAYKLERSQKWGAAIGAAVGLIYRHATGRSNDKEWVPDRTRKKWKLQEYYDHLTYTKYMGLYHAAAEKAKEEEGIDLEDLEDIRERQNDHREKMRKRIEDIKEALKGTKVESDKKEQLLAVLNQKLKNLEESPAIIGGGEWTHSALIYKQAADSTMTGLKKGSSWAQIVTALPTNDREYFMEFVKERDPDKRNKILSTVSPQLRKALNLAWGKTKDGDLDPEKENQEYFKHHKLPDEDWYAWRPDFDLKNVEVKQIANEGMLLSDFGFYESQLRDPDVQRAPTIEDGNAREMGLIGSRLKRVLQGQGLKGVNISVTAAADGASSQIISNIKVFTGMKEVNSMVNNSFQQGIA